MPQGPLVNEAGYCIGMYHPHILNFDKFSNLTLLVLETLICFFFNKVLVIFHDTSVRAHMVRFFVPIRSSSPPAMLELKQVRYTSTNISAASFFGAVAHLNFKARLCTVLHTPREKKESKEY